MSCLNFPSILSSSCSISGVGISASDFASTIRFDNFDSISFSVSQNFLFQSCFLLVLILNSSTDLKSPRVFTNSSSKAGSSKLSASIFSPFCHRRCVCSLSSDIFEMYSSTSVSVTFQLPLLEELFLQLFCSRAEKYLACL
jgi:hypothetical protein